MTALEALRLLEIGMASGLVLMALGVALQIWADWMGDR